jgi:hypothetical protein
MRYPGVVAYRLPIERTLQSQYDLESSGKIREHVHCRKHPAHIFRLIHLASLNRELGEAIRLKVETAMGKCGSHPSRIEDF